MKNNEENLINSSINNFEINNEFEDFIGNNDFSHGLYNRSEISLFKKNDFFKKIFDNNYQNKLSILNHQELLNRKKIINKY